jgi:hypoxanthine phosphoribosyltransferase
MVRYNWETTDWLMDNLAEKIRESDAPDFDAVVGICRGGMFPAGLLAARFAVERVYCLTVEKDDEQRRLTSSIDASLVGNNVALVEDVLETAGSLLVAKHYLEEIKRANVYTAAIHTTPVTPQSARPNFYLGRVDEVPHFPWEAQGGNR